MSLNEAADGLKPIYAGLNPRALASLEIRSYQAGELNERLSVDGVEAGALLAAAERPANWIPGVELFPRRVFRQRHRGHFGELVRLDEALVGRIGLCPRQWASALMHKGTAKGFHIHPPFIPEGQSAESWFQRLFIEEATNYGLRPYSREQWDLMFFVQGNVEVFLIDERAGMPRRRMRFMIDGDDTPGPNNAGLVIPPGVGHGLIVEGCRDLIMVYGTTTSFNPDFEGRIASDVERAALPASWADCFAG